MRIGLAPVAAVDEQVTSGRNSRWHAGTLTGWPTTIWMVPVVMNRRPASLQSFNLTDARRFGRQPSLVFAERADSSMRTRSSSPKGFRMKCSTWISTKEAVMVSTPWALVTITGRSGRTRKVS